MKLFYCIIASFTIVFFGCSASTGSRYDENKETKETKDVKEKKELGIEDFDITSYKTEIKIEKEPDLTGTEQKNTNAWYDYKNTTNNNGTKNVVGTMEGYRVQVVSTDNIEEANKTRDELYSKTNNKEVYVSFEPPFYKVKVGDFKSNSDANNLKFKLNQLGYPEARVIQDTINLFK